MAHDVHLSIGVKLSYSPTDLPKNEKKKKPSVQEQKYLKFHTIGTSSALNHFHSVDCWVP